MNESQPIRLSEEYLSESTKLSRRTFISAAGLVLATGGFLRGREYLYQLEGDHHAVDNYLAERGFTQPSIDGTRFRELSPVNKDTPLTRQEHNLDINIINQSEVLAEVSFNLSSPELLALSITDTTNPQEALPVLELHHSGLEQQVGILETAHNNQAKVMLGEFSGGNRIKIIRTTASQSTQLGQDAISVQAVQVDLLYKNIMHLSPLLGMRKDNFARFIAAPTDEGKTNALTNDMLLAMPVEIRENNNGQLALIYWGLYTSEDGGWGKDPKSMYKKTGGRLFDTDIAAIVILDSDWTVLEMAHQEDNTNGPHQVKIDFTFSPGHKAFDYRLHSAPDHGLVGYELEKKIIKVWRPKPLIQAITSDTDMQDLYYGARVAGLKESIQEVKSALPDIQIEGDPFAINEQQDTLYFLEQKLQEEYDKAV